MSNRKKSAATAELILVLAIISMYPIYTIAVFLPTLAKHFALNNTAMGFLLSMKQMGGLAAALAIGFLTRKYNELFLLRFFFIFSCLGNMICGVGHNFWVYLVGVVLEGAASMGVAVLLPSFLVNYWEGGSGRAVSLSLLPAASAGMLYPLVAEGLLKAAKARPMAAIYSSYLVIAAMLLVGIVILSRSKNIQKLESVQLDKEKESPLPMLSGTFIIMLFLLGLHGGVDSALALWVPRYLESRFSALPITAGIVLFLCSFAYLVSRLLLFSQDTEQQRRKLLVFPGLIGGSILLVSLLLDKPWSVSFGYPLAAFCWSFEYPTLVSQAAEELQDRFTQFMSINMLSSYILTMVFTSGVGILSDQTGNLFVPFILLACGFIAFGLIAYFAGLGRHGDTTLKFSMARKLKG